MATRATKTLSFTQEQASFVDSLVKSGRFQSASEVVRAALRLLVDAEAEREARFERMQERVHRGLLEIDRDRVVDGEDFMQLLRERERDRGSDVDGNGTRG